MTLDERFAAHARDWNVMVAEVRTTETSQLGFGARGNQPVVLKVIRKENGEAIDFNRNSPSFATVAPVSGPPSAR